MADKLFLELVSPERSLVSMEVDEVVATGVEGEFGLLAGHSPFFTSLKAGGLTYKLGQDIKFISLARGFLEVSDDKVVVLAENAEFGTDINISEAITLKEEAEKIIELNKHLDNEEFKAAEVALDYQNVRIEIAEKARA